MRQALESVVGAGKFTVGKSTAVGPKVGAELRSKAFLAILLSFAAVLAYLAIRFEWRFGLAAVAATAHDLLATLAFIAIMRIEVSLFVVAALLSIVGYSLNDTIVIFDRVRENLHKAKQEGFANILNRSVNDTLPRTVLTGGTALGSLIAMAALGGDVVRPFALDHAVRRRGRHLLVHLHRLAHPAGDRAAVARPACARRATCPPAKGQAPSGRKTQPATRGRGAGRHPLPPDRRGVRRRPGEVAARAWDEGVGHIVVIGESPEAADRALALAASDPRVSATAGVHPHIASEWTAESAGWLRQRLADSRVVAAGEMGLDYHYDHSPRDVQRTVFDAQLGLAAEAGRPP